MFETLTRYRIKKLTLVYVVALSMVALLNVGAFVVVEALIATHAHDAPVINLAGRQRMLSQRLARDVLTLARAQDPAQAARLRDELRTDEAMLARVQRGLRVGEPSLGLPGANSPSCVALLEAAESRQQALSQGVRETLSSPGPPSPALVDRIVEESTAYLPIMDQLVASYQHEAESRTRSLSRTETGIVAAALALLLAEALLIFRPMIRRVWDSYMQLRALHQELETEVAQRRRAEQEKERLEGLLPICASCKRIRDDGGAWHAIERYVEHRSKATFSHGICPDCAAALYPEYFPRVTR